MDWTSPLSKVITVCKPLISSLNKMTENTTCGFGCHRFNLERQMSNGRLYNNVKPLHGRVNHRSNWLSVKTCFVRLWSADPLTWRELVKWYRGQEEISLPVLPICEIFSKQMFKVLHAMPYRVPHILLHKTPQHVCCVDRGYIRDKSSSTGDSETLRWTLQCWHMSYLCQNLTGRWGSVFSKNLF